MSAAKGNHQPAITLHTGEDERGGGADEAKEGASSSPLNVDDILSSEGQRRTTARRMTETALRESEESKAGAAARAGAGRGEALDRSSRRRITLHLNMMKKGASRPGAELRVVLVRDRKPSSRARRKREHFLSLATLLLFIMDSFFYGCVLMRKVYEK